MSTTLNLSSTLNGNIQNSLQTYNTRLRNTININLDAMRTLTNVVDEDTGYITDLTITSPETDLLIGGILNIMQVGLSAGFLKMSVNGTSEKKFYVSFMIPYRPSICEIKLVAVAAVDITYLIRPDHVIATPPATNAPIARSANNLYTDIFEYNNANYTQWVTELQTAFNNSLDLVSAFIAADGDAQF